MKNIFIAGNPGIGKTSLIKETLFPFIDKIGGFYTEEIREQGKRMGFRLKTFSGQEAIFAYKGWKTGHKLNKYGIDLKILEDVGIKSILEALEKKEIIVVDEVGTMECMSPLFMETIVKCLNSDKRVLATVRSGSQPFSKEVGKMADTELIQLTKESYVQIKTKLREWIEHG